MTIAMAPLFDVKSSGCLEDKWIWSKKYLACLAHQLPGQSRKRARGGASGDIKWGGVRMGCIRYLGGFVSLGFGYQLDNPARHYFQLITINLDKEGHHA